MVFDGRLRRVGAAMGLFAAGFAAAAALRGGLYANLALACCTAAWFAVLARPADPAPPAAARGAPDVLALRTELRRLRMMLDHAPAPLVLLSADGALRVVNRSARRLFGTDEIIIDPAGGLADAIAAAPPGRPGVIRLAAQDGGAARSYALSVAAWSAGEHPALLAALIDVEAEMQAAEAAALRDVLQTLSHEIMNSLTPVMSLAETAGALLAEHGAGGAEAAKDALETIARRARGLDRFVQGYRALARVPPPVPRSTSVRLLMHDIARLFAMRWRQSGLTLTMMCPEPDIIAPIDADLVTQGLMALLTNGAEAALAAADRPAAVTLAVQSAGTGLRFRVSDSGAGIAPQDRDLVFQPLFTRKPGGTGIGLGLARQIALSHGGNLSLEPSAEDGGATFWFCLL